MVKRVMIIMKFSKAMLNAVIETAQRSDHENYKIGAGLIKHKTLIGVGCNSVHRSARSFNKKYIRWPHSIHAEVAAILSCKSYIDSATAVVIRLARSKKYGLAKPCVHCLGYLDYVGVKDVFYSISSDELEFEHIRLGEILF